MSPHATDLIASDVIAVGAALGTVASLHADEAASRDLFEVAGVAVRRPYRQGPSEQQLVNAADDVAYADSGAPDYEYTTLEVEDWVTSGDPVGAPVLWDSVSGGPVGTVVGIPDTQRLSGMSEATANDRVDLLDVSGCKALILVFNGDFVSTKGVCQPRSGESGPNIIMQSIATRVLLRVIDTAGGNTLQLIVSSLTAGADYQVAFVRDAGGTNSIRMYDAAGALLGSTSGGTQAWTSIDLLSRSNGGSPLDNGEIKSVKGWASPLTGLEMDAVATGGGPVADALDVSGLRSGVLDPSDTSILVIGDDAGLSVLAP